MQSYGLACNQPRETEMITRHWRVELPCRPLPNEPIDWVRNPPSQAQLTDKSAITWRTYHVTARCRVHVLSRKPQLFINDIPEEKQAISAACELARAEGLWGLTILDHQLYGTPAPDAVLE